MKKVFLLITLLGSLSVCAQTQLFRGDVEIKGDPRIDSLIQQHIALNKKFPEIEGYRVMVFFDSGNNSKDSANRVIERFHEEYPAIPAYLSFNSPYYRVRVGNFRDRMEAERFVNEIKGMYPNAWVIETLIEPPQLKGKVEKEQVIQEDDLE